MKSILPFKYFLLFWFIFNILQAAFTYLHFDEAYYWMYAQKLSWGYFDHPPMVAVLGFLGYHILPNELGQRLFFVILSSGTMIMLIKLIAQKTQVRNIILIILSFPLVFLHVSGFMSLPDIPLLFFSMLLIHIYKRFLDKNNLKYAILFGITAACLILSKYHGGLLLFFILLSNPKLIRNKFAWIALSIMLLLISPHIIWQINNDFPSFKYHLYQRADGFNFANIFHYIGSTLLVFGVFTGAIVFYCFFVFRPKDLFEKALQYIGIGTIIFFLIMSFRDNMEAHWVAIAIPSSVYICTNVLIRNTKLHLWFNRLAITAIMLVFLFRIFLLKAIPSFGIKEVLWNWNSQFETVKNQIKNTPVIVDGSYKTASLFSFYNSSLSPVLSDYWQRYTQYDLLQLEEMYIGDTVFILTNKCTENDTLFADPKHKFCLRKQSSFISYRNIAINVEQIALDSGKCKISGILINESAHTLPYNGIWGVPQLVVFSPKNKDSIICSTSITDATQKQEIIKDENQKFSLPAFSTNENEIIIQIRFATYRGKEQTIHNNIYRNK